MKEFKGTPGQWVKDVERINGRSYIVAKSTIFHGKRKTSKFIYSYKIDEDDCGNEKCCCKEEHANASLIAAAPDLLETLNTINNWLVCSAIASPEDMAQSFEDMQKLAQSAINKALGS